MTIDFPHEYQYPPTDTEFQFSRRWMQQDFGACKKMQLPHAEHAYVDKSKVTEYLLSLSHPDGRSKARFFSRLGFEVEKWWLLADALVQVARNNPVVSVVESVYGLRYTVDGRMMTPVGRNPKVTTVWFIERGMCAPRLITSYPVG